MTPCVAVWMPRLPGVHFPLVLLETQQKYFRNFLLWMLKQTLLRIKLRRTIRFTIFQQAWTLPRLANMQITSLMNSPSSPKSQWQGTWKPWLGSWIKAPKYLITATAFAMKLARVDTIARLNSQDLFRLTFARCSVKAKAHSAGLRYRAIQKILRVPTKQCLICSQTMITYVAGSPWPKIAWHFKVCQLAFAG